MTLEDMTSAEIIYDVVDQEATLLLVQYDEAMEGEIQVTVIARFETNQPLNQQRIKIDYQINPYIIFPIIKNQEQYP